MRLLYALYSANCCAARRAYSELWFSVLSQGSREVLRRWRPRVFSPLAVTLPPVKLSCIVHKCV